MARMISAVTVIFGTAESIRSMRDSILATEDGACEEAEGSLAAAPLLTQTLKPSISSHNAPYWLL